MSQQMSQILAESADESVNGLANSLDGLASESANELAIISRRWMR